MRGLFTSTPVQERPLTISPTEVEPRKRTGVLAMQREEADDGQVGRLFCLRLRYLSQRSLIVLGVVLADSI